LTEVEAAERTRRRHDLTRDVELTAAVAARRADELRRAKRQAVRDDLVVLHFNPWGYVETGQIWAGLAYGLTSELREVLSRWERLELRVRYVRERKVAELLAAIATLLVAAAVTAVAATQGVSFSSSGSGGIVYVGTLVLLALVFWRAARGTKPVVDWISDRFRPRDHAGGMGYQHEVIQDLQFYADGLRRGREQCRMIVFIDDLDRCSDEQILEFLGAINLVLVSSGFYVVMGIDTRMIRDAVRAMHAARGIDVETDEDIGDSYLRKIVQIAYRVPTADPALRYSSVRGGPSGSAQGHADHGPIEGESSSGGDQILVEPDEDHLGHPIDEPSMPVDEQPVERTLEEISAFHDLQVLLPENPRQLKRMVNVHRLAKMLMRADELPWPPDQQRWFVVWTVVSFRWPAAVRDALDDGAPAGPDTRSLLDLLEKRVPAHDAWRLEALDGTPTMGTIRNLKFDYFLECCGVLPQRSAKPTARSAGS
jgi:KAP family P-loop domain